MPCLELSLPRLSAEQKQVLARALTEAFVGATGHRREIFGIRFFEYDAGEAAVGGVVLDERTPVAEPPYLHALLYCPRLTRRAKQALAEGLSTAFGQALAQPNWRPIVHICEHPYDNVIVDGQLLSDTYAACAERKFYYELPRD